MTLASEAIRAAKLRVATAGQAVESAKTQVQMSSQMLESAKSQVTSSENELEEAREHLEGLEKKWQVIDVDLDSNDSGGDGDERRKKQAVDKKNNDKGGSNGEGDNNSHKLQSIQKEEVGDGVGDDRKRPAETNGENEARKRRVQSSVGVSALHSAVPSGLTSSHGRMLVHSHPLAGQSQIIVVDQRQGKAFFLEVNLCDTIGSVKAKIFTTMGIPSGKQMLVYQRVCLEDGHTLRDYHIQQGSFLNLHCRDVNMSIFVKDSTSIFPVDARPSDTIYDIKTKLHVATGTPPERQDLFYDGGLLDDAHTLSAYGISSQSYLNLAYDGISISVELLARKTATSRETLSLGIMVFLVQVDSESTLLKIKTAIRDKHGIPINQQILGFDGILMDDGCPLSDYNVRQGSALCSYCFAKALY